MKFLISSTLQVYREARHALGAGWCGLVLVPLSIYCGLAFLMEDVNQRTILPLLRRGTARQSLEGDLGDQFQRIEREAGVRNQL